MPLRSSDNDVSKAPNQGSNYQAETEIATPPVCLLLGYGVKLLLCTVLIIYMRRKRNEALQGDINAARKVLLPAYEPLLWMIGVVSATYSMYFTYAVVEKLHITAAHSVSSEIYRSGSRFIILLVVVFMLQKSVSLPALARATCVSLCLATYTIPVAWILSTSDNLGATSTNKRAMNAAQAPVLIFFLYVAIYPPGRASKRVLREYCVYCLVYYTLELAYIIPEHLRMFELQVGLIYTGVIWGSLSPLVIWRVLKADTEHWRGFGQRACQLQSFFRQTTTVNEQISSQGLHVLIEMHRKYIIDFAYLRLIKRIGVGSSAVMYDGLLHSKTAVAIKVYTPAMITDGTVAEFSNEAALCGALGHPNIVKFYGMCVSPPTICLVSELCQGSLDVITATIAKRSYEPRRQQFLINIGYMIDAARAIAYLHSFSPALVHRDIKPANFLVDAQGNVKLTDFGESRSLPRANNPPSNETCTRSTEEILTPWPPTSWQPTDINVQSRADMEHATKRSSRASLATPLIHMHGDPKAHSTHMTVKGTADYMAPEVINGKGGLAQCDEAADIYALAMTMWEILYPGMEKYPAACNKTFRVFELVLAGQRPQLCSTLHPGLREMFLASWHIDSRQRPRAQDIVHILEQIQKETAATFALELSEVLRQDTAVFVKADELDVQTIAGDWATHKMRSIRAVSSIGEGVRLGNLLMNAGFLHHVRHTQPFESSATEMYFLDDSFIALSQPFASLERGSRCPDGSGVEACARSSQAYLNLSRNNHSSFASARTGSCVRISSSSDEDSHLGVSSADGSNGHPTLSDSMGTMYKTSRCACRRLSQGERLPKSAARLFRWKQNPVIQEEHALTSNLLARDIDRELDIRFACSPVM
ncbi:Tkl/drk protein kinase, partial [Globisporangium splendens]